MQETVTHPFEPETTSAPTPELAGKTIAVPETRELDVLAQLFQQRGALVLRCPLVSILDAPDPKPIEGWLHRFVADGCDDLVIFTGEGLRRLLRFAERIDLREAFVAALGRVRKVTRGPKPVRALREIGLAADVQASTPTTDGVIAALGGFDLKGRTVGVQLYGGEPNPPLMDFLTNAGAIIDLVAPYVYASNIDDERVGDLIARLAEGGVDVIAFTSASQVRRLWDVARQRRLEEALRAGLAHTVVAAVGPVAAAEASRFGMNPAIMPTRVPSMKPLVNAVAAAMQARR
ncbi:MAG: uroporphyrinogen-III synthase [Rhodospirillales bacterium]